MRLPKQPTHRKHAEEALLGMSGKLIEAQEQERTRISRELHDDIGQRLAMAVIELQELHEDPLILPEVRNRMGKLQKQTSEIATDIQSLSHELHSAKLQYLGIAVATKGFCREFGEQQKVEIDFQTHDLPSPVPPDIALCFFRVLQEALHNSAKHSGVRQFEVRLWGTSDEIHLTVADSGAGFDREAAKTSRGLGLTSMQERLRLVGGALSIESQPRRGTTIHARVLSLQVEILYWRQDRNSGVVQQGRQGLSSRPSRSSTIQTLRAMLQRGSSCHSWKMHRNRKSPGTGYLDWPWPCHRSVSGEMLCASRM
jgi:signal transduction histidine kinase